MKHRRIVICLLVALLASGPLFVFQHWSASAAPARAPRATTQPLNSALAPSSHAYHVEDRPPAPSIQPYVRPEFAAEMRLLQPAIVAAAKRHNQAQLSGLSDHEFAMVIALIMYNEHFGWFEEKVTPIQALTPFYEDLQRETNVAGISNLSVWPANLRPSVALEILRHELPLPRSTTLMTVPVAVDGSHINLNSYTSQAALYAAITDEISDPVLAVEYLAANLERGVYRAEIEHVPVTWRTLAAWHNQGIVAPQDIRANATASDYLRRSTAYLRIARALIDTPQRPASFTAR